MGVAAAVVLVLVASTAYGFTATRDAFDGTDGASFTDAGDRNYLGPSVPDDSRGQVVPVQANAQPTARQTTGSGINRVPVGISSTLDQFGSALGAGTAAGGAQQGQAQVSIRDRSATGEQSREDNLLRKLENGDVGATRRDQQDRAGSLVETDFNNQDKQSQGSQYHASRSYDQNIDQASEQGRRQSDVNDRHGGGQESVGRYNRQDVASNVGDKYLSAIRNAYLNQAVGREKVDYGFNKNFDTDFNERGGFQEAVGQDNLNSDVYEENQRDNRFSKGLLDAFRRSNDLSSFRKQSDWLSNAAQRQQADNRFGSRDRLQNAAENQQLDWNALLDRKNNLIWNRDSAQDKALRQANDVAEKRGAQQKNALAQASGNKGVVDNKYYGGESFGKNPSATGSVSVNTPTVGLGTGAGSPLAGTGRVPYAGSGPVAGSGIVTSGGPAGRGVVSPDNVRGRQEGSGGDYVNRYAEKARQADLSNQQQASNAQSDAKALNDYSRGRGVDDSLEINGQRQGKWAKNQTGLKDANSKAFNGANADLAKSGQLADRNAEARASNSQLVAANKNLQAQELDRLNYKKNEVDSTQKVVKQKKFYHDKNEDGFNNEALTFNHDKASNENGEQQQAQKAARTSFNNAANDAKVTNSGRAYVNQDDRRISNADAYARDKDEAGGWLNEKRDDHASAARNRAAFQSGRQNKELDNFARTVSNRNQQLWDQARRDQAQRQRADSRDRAVDGRFLFTQDSPNNVLGLGTSGQTFPVSRAVPAGNNGVSFHSGFAPSFSHGSSFTGGFNSPHGGFIGDMGRTNFGQTSFGPGTHGPTNFDRSGARLYRE